MTLADRAAAAALAAGPSGAQSRGAAGASVSPAGRRRHSGAQRSPLPIVPRTPTAFPSVACRGGSEPPARPSPPPTPRQQGRLGSSSREAKSGDPGRQARAVVAPSLQPARRGGQPPRSRRSSPPSFLAHPSHPSALSPCRMADSGVCSAEENRRAGSWEVVMCAAGAVNCFLPGVGS